MIIQELNNPLTEGGLLDSWRAYLGEASMNGAVRLQIWRLDLPETKTAHLVGQTDIRSVTSFGEGSVTFTLEPQERVRVEAGDLVGLQFYGSNPIPYEVRKDCTVEQNSHVMQFFSSADFTIDLTEPYRNFGMIDECRRYALQVTVEMDGM